MKELGDIDMTVKSTGKFNGYEGTHKNSRQTDIICIGNNTRKVVSFKTVTSEDRVAQRNEKPGTFGKRYHDNNVSISRYVR